MSFDGDSHSEDGPAGDINPEGDHHEDDLRPPGSPRRTENGGDGGSNDETLVTSTHVARSNKVVPILGGGQEARPATEARPGGHQTEMKSSSSLSPTEQKADPILTAVQEPQSPKEEAFTLRAEIKQWEKEFREREGRDPGKADKNPIRSKIVTLNLLKRRLKTAVDDAEDVRAEDPSKICIIQWEAARYCTWSLAAPVCCSLNSSSPQHLIMQLILAHPFRLLDPTDTSESEDAAIARWKRESRKSVRRLLPGGPIKAPAGEREGEEIKDAKLFPLRIVRHGNCEGSVSVTWETFSLTATERNFIKVPPTMITFEPGETFREVHVKILDNIDYDGCVDFGVYLDGTSLTDKNTMVGKFLHTAFVKIIDDDVFPGEEVRELVEDGLSEEIEKIHPFTLIWYFIRFSLTPEMRKRTWANALGNILDNAVHILHIVLLLWIVSDIGESPQDLDEEAIERRKKLVSSYAIVWVAPLLLQHYVKYVRVKKYGIAPLRVRLQNLIFSRFLHYEMEPRGRITTEHLLMSMTRDVDTVVDECFIPFRDIISGPLMKIIMLLFTMIYVQLRANEWKFNKLDIDPFLLLMPVPIMILTFLYIRSGEAAVLNEKRLANENKFISTVIYSVIHFQLIEAFSRQGQAVRTYDERVRGFSSGLTAFNAYTTNSRMFVPWLARVGVGLKIFWWGLKVLDGEYALSDLLSTIFIFQQLGTAFDDGYQLQIRMQSSIASLRSITEYLNLPIDVPRKHLQSVKAITESQKLLRLELELTQRGKLDMSDPHELPADRLPIVLRDVDFKYHIGEDETSLHTVQKLNANFRQGHLICLTGPPKQGKSTILRLLGESILPDEVKENLVFVPPHVRVVTVPEHPVVLGPEETIFENLCYGLAIDQTELKNDKDTNAALMARARNILALLGCDRAIVENIDKEGFLGADGSKLTRTDRQLISLARAFLLNPELLLMHKPTALLGPEHAKLVSSAMKQFVEGRGLLVDRKPGEAKVRRRLRTIIFTAASPKEVPDFADEVYDVVGGTLKKRKNMKRTANAILSLLNDSG
jgi:ABC-type multidrug transport system fused ATPase/permease subunit